MLSQNYGDQVIQLKSNKMPRGLITLETIFNKDDVVKKTKAGLVVQQEHCIELELEPSKSLHFGKVNTDLERQEYTKLFNELSDVFSWKNEDLKGFDRSLTQHTIELEPNAKPVRQK